MAKLLIFYLSRYSCRQTIHQIISKHTSTSRRQIDTTSTSISATKRHAQLDPVHSCIELDSHADTIVAGSNCVAIDCTGEECDVSPFQKDYDAIENGKIATVATSWQS